MDDSILIGMRSSRISIVAALALLSISAGFLLWMVQKKATAPNNQISRKETSTNQASGATTQTSRVVNALGTIKASEMTADERAVFLKRFEEKFKPAAIAWAKAYDHRVPFKPDELTPEKLVERLGKNPSFYLYTFVFDGITLTIQESGDMARVSYLMTRQAGKELNQIPGPAFVPNLNVPISREDATRMLEADYGKELKPNEILIKPTAVACALNGGAFVDFLPTGADPNNGLSYKISIVFDATGKIVNYERDPLF